LVVTADSREILPCDLDGDGDVDAGDRTLFLNAYRKCVGDTGYLAEADYDGDGCVTLNDYRAWYACYNSYLNQ
jgi:hypothetical protein